MFGKRKEDAMLCPLIRTACVEAKCLFWLHIRGKHPQTGADIDLPDCAVRWLPVLLIEGAQESRQTAAAVESFRNEMVRANSRSIALMQRVALAQVQSQAEAGVAHCPGSFWESVGDFGRTRCSVCGFVRGVS